MMFKFVGMAAAATLLGGCIIIDADDDYIRTDFDHDGHQVGSVFAADLSGNTASFQVTSHGCTTRDFFDVDVVKEDDDAFEIGLRRIRQDNCRALMPDGTQVSWSFAELGIPDGAQVTVRNQIRR